MYREFLPNVGEDLNPSDPRIRYRSVFGPFRYRPPTCGLRNKDTGVRSKPRAGPVDQNLARAAAEILPAESCVQLHLTRAAGALELSEEPVIHIRNQARIVRVIEEVKHVGSDPEP